LSRYGAGNVELDCAGRLVGDAVRSPAGAPFIGRPPRPVAFRQVAPRSTGPQPPRHPVEHLSGIPPRRLGVPGRTRPAGRQERADHPGRPAQAARPDETFARTAAESVPGELKTLVPAAVVPLRWAGRGPAADADVLSGRLARYGERPAAPSDPAGPGGRPTSGRALRPDRVNRNLLVTMRFARHTEEDEVPIGLTVTAPPRPAPRTGADPPWGACRHDWAWPTLRPSRRPRIGCGAPSAVRNGTGVCRSPTSCARRGHLHETDRGTGRAHRLRPSGQRRRRVVVRDQTAFNRPSRPRGPFRPVRPAHRRGARLPLHAAAERGRRRCGRPGPRHRAGGGEGVLTVRHGTCRGFRRAAALGA
jgi:hypothetical protein